MLGYPTTQPEELAVLSAAPRPPAPVEWPPLSKPNSKALDLLLARGAVLGSGCAITYNVNHWCRLGRVQEVHRLAMAHSASIVALQETRCATPSFAKGWSVLSSHTLVGVALCIHGSLPYAEVVLPASPDWELVCADIFLPQPKPPSASFPLTFTPAPIASAPGTLSCCCSKLAAH